MKKKAAKKKNKAINQNEEKQPKNKAYTRST
jgi:hypothetical protein